MSKFNHQSDSDTKQRKVLSGNFSANHQQASSDTESVIQASSDRNDGGDEPSFESDHLDEQPRNHSGGRRRRTRRGIYLLPNLFTTGALFSGFYATVAAMNGDFIIASIAIFIAMVLDGMDGRVARLTNSTSEFGAQYDSLSDLVAFGMAPSLLTFCWSISDLGNVGWIAAFMYVSCAALRLARFNVQADSVDKRFFIGLPSPAAAALVAGMVWALSEYKVDGKQMAWFAAFVVAGAGALMVSNFKFYSFKDIDFKGRVPFFAVVVVMLVFAVVSVDPAKVLLAVFFAYACSGPVRWFIVWRRRVRRMARIRNSKSSRS